MPYTLTSVGAWVARQRLRRPIVVSTALVQTRSDTSLTALERWSASLETVDPTRHAEGKRAVALVSNGYTAVVVPFAWVDRLPLRKPAPVALPRPYVTYEYSVVAYDEGLVEEPTKGAPPISIPPFTPTSLRETYQDVAERAAWWEEFTATTWGKVDPDHYEKQLAVVNVVQQLRRDTRAQVSGFYLRQLDAYGGRTYHARCQSREYFDRDNVLWISERIFRVFASDKLDFDRHYILTSMHKTPLLAVIDRRSHLVVGFFTALPHSRIARRLIS